jgi:hypothetical protein
MVACRNRSRRHRYRGSKHVTFHLTKPRNARQMKPVSRPSPAGISDRENHNSFRMRTYAKSQNNPFRMRTYKKTGGGVTRK